MATQVQPIDKTVLANGLHLHDAPPVVSSSEAISPVVSIDLAWTASPLRKKGPSMRFHLQATYGRSTIFVLSLSALMLAWVTIPARANAQTAQPKPEVVKACPPDIQQLHFDALILEGKKTQKVWYLHNKEVHPGKTCVVVNGWTEAGPAGWEPMKGVHQFILEVSIDGSIQKLIGDDQAGKRVYVIDIPAHHDGLFWVCNQPGHFIHSGGSVAANGEVLHNGIAKVSYK
jgi:hypothetical protein